MRHDDNCQNASNRVKLTTFSNITSTAQLTFTRDNFFGA